MKRRWIYIKSWIYGMKGQKRFMMHLMNWKMERADTQAGEEYNGACKGTFEIQDRGDT